MMIEEISATTLKAKYDAGETFQLIDVRQPNENSFASIEGGKLIPLGEIVSRMDELDPNVEAVVYCKMGGRSAQAIQVLQQSGYTGKLLNLRGGIIGWSTDIDPSIPKY